MLKNPKIFLSAIFLTYIFSSTPLVLAQENVTPTAASAENPLLKFYNAEIPEEIGTVEQRWMGKSDKMLILLQDSHVSLEVQLHIAEVIQLFVNEYGLELVNIEGADHEKIDFQELRDLEPRNIVEKVSVDFLKESRINGAVYAKINNEKDFLQYGTEDKDAYLTNYKHYINVVEQNEKILEDLHELWNTMMKKKDRFISPELIEFINIQVLFRDGDTNMLYYFKEAVNQAQKVGIELIEYPVIYNLIEIAFNEEKSSQFKTVDSKKLLDELAELGQAIKDKMATTEEAKNFIRLQDKLMTLEEILILRVLQTDYEIFQKDRTAYDPDALQALIKRVFPKWDAPWVYDVPGVLEEAENFYTVAHDRSLIMFEHSLENMEKENKNVSVLVSGGYHTEEIVALCRQNDISYLRIMPNITDDAVTVDYEGRMLELKAELLGGEETLNNSQQADSEA